MCSRLIVLFLVACSQAQLIYPDEYERIKILANAGQSSTVIRDKQPIPTMIPTAISSPPIAPVSAQFEPSDQPPRAYNPLQNWAEHVDHVISMGIMKFGLQVEKEVGKSQFAENVRDNVIFSPISLAVTMAMVLLGSAGTTFDEVANLLGLQTGIDISRHSEVVHQILGLQLQQTHKKIFEVPGPRVDFASAIFLQDGYPIRPEFTTVAQNVYQSKVINVDFLRNGVGAKNTINNWVAENTNGKIKNILSSMPDPLTTLILASALYFKGEWNQHFFATLTKRRPFYIEPNQSVIIDMMFNAGDFPYYEDKQLGAQILGLPYKGNDIWMYILLPKAEGANALRGFADQLTPEIIQNLISNMKNETCIIALPRMKLSSSLSLTKTLQNLGLRSLFSANADLSVISSGGPIIPTVTPLQTSNNVIRGPRPSGNSKGFNQQHSLVRFGEDLATDGTRKNFFAYHDKLTGLTVQQWSTGFSIAKGRIRRRAMNKRAFEEFSPDLSNEETTRNSYVIDEAEAKKDHAKFVSLEENKYRFKETKGSRLRRKRQARPIDENFLNYINSLNFPSYGIDNLRNSGTLKNPGIYASNVLHKVEIDISEKGTEAAAATTVVLERDGSQKRIIANRPFIFFIRHNPTKLMLFWGTLNLPTPNYPAT